jgi:GNAT superfamily N-acetyltransferase
MPLRDLILPSDLNPLAEMVVQTFQYPENPNWSVQSDEKEFILDGIRNISRIWSLVKLAGKFSPQLQDIFRGCVWEEDGKLVGTSIVQRRGSSSGWIIGTVGVLPEYRRRGIAKVCVERAVKIIREHGGEKVTLSVIDGNVPALRLYESLGFEIFSGDVEFQAFPEEAPDIPEIPAGYAIIHTSHFDWEPRYRIAKRTTPETHHKYEPVEVARFKQSGIMRLVLPIIIHAQGTKEEWLLIKSTKDDQVTGYAGYSYPRPGKKGFNQIWLRLDPDHDEIAPFVIRYLIHKVVSNRPGLRVECSIASYMKSILATLENEGFERRVTYHRMGAILS